MVRTEEILFRVLRGGAAFAQIYPQNGPVLRMRGDGEIKMSLSGSFHPCALDADGREVEVNFLSDEIQPVLKMDGTEYLLGVYMIADVTPSGNESGETLGIEAYDRCWRIRDTKAEARLYFSAGTNYITAVESLLTGAGITTVSKMKTSAVLNEAREWEVGTSYLTVINTLLMEINYKQLWFNEKGIAMLEPSSVPKAANIRHILSGNSLEPYDILYAKAFSITPKYSGSNDVFDAPNVFICYCANPDKDDIYIAKEENDNPQSPLSISRRGRRIVSVEKVDNIANADELQKYAKKRRNDSQITGETIQVETALLPGFGVDDVTALQYGDINAIYVEKEWTMTLKPGGMMTHLLKKVVYNFG